MNFEKHDKQDEKCCVFMSYRKSSAKYFPGAFLCDAVANISVSSLSWRWTGQFVCCKFRWLFISYVTWKNVSIYNVHSNDTAPVLFLIFRCSGEMLLKTSTQLCVFCSEGSGESVSVSVIISCVTVFLIYLLFTNRNISAHRSFLI